jgi:hypothetical protein
MTAAAIGAMLATLLLLLAVIFDLWWGAEEVAMYAGWAAGVALAVAGISLLAGRRRLSLSGVCFIASAPLVAVASVLLFTSAGGISAAVYFGTPVIVAALLLALAGVLAFRSASRVALAAGDREVADARPGPPRVAAEPEVLDARSGSPGAPDPVSLHGEERSRSALVFPSIALAFDAMLLAVLWWWTSVNTEGDGIDIEVQLAFLAWLVGVAVAGVGVILLADPQRRRYAALVLLAAGLLGFAAVVVFAVAHSAFGLSATEESEVLRLLMLWAFVSSPFLFSGFKALRPEGSDDDDN